MVTGRKPDLKCVYHAEKGIREVDSRYGDALNLKSMCHYTSASLDMREMHEFEMEWVFFLVQYTHIRLVSPNPVSQTVTPDLEMNSGPEYRSRIQITDTE